MVNTADITASKDLHIVVVGASGGIGRALIDRLLQDATVAKVYGLSRNYYQPEFLASSGSSPHSPSATYEHLVVDYEDEATIKYAAGQLTQQIDRVIVATGFLHDESIRPEKTFKQVTSDKLLHNMLVNVVGPSLIAKHFLPALRSDRKTVFAALSARVGSISDNQLGGWYSYRASKAALNMMIKTFSVELKRVQPQTVIVGLHPGTVDTGLSKPFQRNVAPNKLFAREHSAGCLLNVIEKLTLDDSGYCFAWDGQRIAE
ncbi:MAG: NAD(P)-dependent dehydrogenase (short-subunit alcohol dehydrogenase family) [Candidatus Endobugula sp.]|jgi:NAD(P)-dependent dehydrogenase (short-subunit alcohol dehydrogenase family)